MGLEEYKHKRRFTKTPEPIGYKKKSLNKLHFVVQKHYASHLHYDFRLEMDGTLKSWAIPKGPSLNPQDKRLAIMVEDHPLEYKDFEGIIPPGNYGAGKVIIWDEGNYEFKDFNNLKQGHINFILHGKKLSGEFSLIKLKNTDKNWLLIKKNDNKAQKKDILKKNKSVRRLHLDKKIDAILQNGIKQIMPKYIKPMLAHLIREPFDRLKWLFEIKWDGYRIIAYTDHKKVRLLSRNQVNYSEIFNLIAKQLGQLEIKAIFDGEVVVVDSKGQSQFQLLQQYQKTGTGLLMYYIFDILWLNGFDLRALPLHQRKALLNMILPKLPNIRISDHIDHQGKDFFALATKKKLEGIMAKDANSVYESGRRSHSWLKIKTKQKQEVIIGGYTAPRGGRTYLGALIVGIYKNKQLQYVGHVGVPDEKNRIIIRDMLDQLTITDSPFASTSKINAPPTWVKPNLICEVTFSEWTDDGHLRQPIFLGLKENKPVKPKRAHTAEKKLESAEDKDSTILEVDNHPLKITHLSKVYWPEQGYSKSDLIDYYQKIADIILPYLKDKPQILHRHPHGITAQGFYQKNYPDAPKWISQSIIHSHHRNRDIHYLLCQNRATLLYLANLGCIEMNPWLSRINSLEKPDFCVIDLDPEAIEFSAVVKTAQVIHRLLVKMGVESYCKTSGATGLHIYIPLAAKYSYEQSVQFAELVAIAVNNQLSNITSVVRSPAKRQGKVYIDYLQNRFGQSLASPYSARPVSGAWVSTPLQWDEVNTRLNPAKFTIKTIFKRLEKLGDIWQDLLTAKGVNLSSALRKMQKLG